LFAIKNSAEFTADELMLMIGYTGNKETFQNLCRLNKFKYKQNKSYAEKLREIKFTNKYTLSQLANIIDYDGDNIVSLCNRNNIEYRKVTIVDAIREIKDTKDFTAKELATMVNYQAGIGSFYDLLNKYEIPYATKTDRSISTSIKALGDTSQLYMEEIKEKINYQGNLHTLKGICNKNHIPYKSLNYNSFNRQLKRIDTQNYTMEELMQLVQYTGDKYNFRAILYTIGCPYKKDKTLKELLHSVDTHKYTLSEIAEIIEYKNSLNSLRDLCYAYGIKFKHATYSKIAYDDLIDEHHLLKVKVEQLEEEIRKLKAV
jgi:hypothetical protein